MVTREITIGELMFLRQVLEAEEVDRTEVNQAIELVDALINYKEKAPCISITSEKESG